MKKKIYLIMVSVNFPAYHPRKGQPTNFEQKILSGEKIHTIRPSYDIWKKREELVNTGKAIVSIRKWQGKPYRSNMTEIMQLEKIGVQKIEFDDYLYSCIIDGKRFGDIDTLTQNDGLEHDDFEIWFNKCPDKLMTILHFTDFRY